MCYDVDESVANGNCYTPGTLHLKAMGVYCRSLDENETVPSKAALYQLYPAFACKWSN